MPWDFGKLVVCIISTKFFVFILRCVMFIAYTQKTTQANITPKIDPLSLWI